MMTRYLICSCTVLLLCFPARAGQLTGSVADVATGSQVNLTAVGTADWIHWGLNGDRDVNRKAGVGPQISTFTLLTGEEDVYLSAFQYTNNFNGYTWNDGMSAAAVTNATVGVYVYAYYLPVGTGFEITAPADTRPRTLKVYVGVYSGEGTLVASLSDASAAAYTNSFDYNNLGEAQVYTFTYAANTNQQTLRVRWTLTQKQGPVSAAPNVTLQAAALTTPGISVLPAVSITSPTNGANHFAGDPLSLQASATDLDGTVTNVAFYSNGSWIGQTTNPPFLLEWEGAAPGFHTLTAVATDNAGETSTSTPVEVFIHDTASVLTGNVTTLPAGTGTTPVDLSAEGTLDWIHWGYTAPVSVDRMIGVPPLISTFTHLGTNPVQQLVNAHASWTWTNGTPTAENFYSTTGVSAIGRTNGFEVRFDASPQGRRARVYFGLYGSRAHIRAYLTNHSAPALVDHSVSNIFGVTDGVIEVRYASASPEEELVVLFESEERYDPLYSSLRLMSATVQVDDSVFLPLTLSNASGNGDAFVFSLLTQPNHTYYIERKPALDAAIWEPVTNFPGIAGVLTITNPPSAEPAGYYRARAQ